MDIIPFRGVIVHVISEMSAKEGATYEGPNS
jgi:hypothetical protein